MKIEIIQSKFQIWCTCFRSQHKHRQTQTYYVYPHIQDSTINNNTSGIYIQNNHIPNDNAHPNNMNTERFTNVPPPKRVLYPLYSHILRLISCNIPKCNQITIDIILPLHLPPMNLLLPALPYNPGIQSTPPINRGTKTV